MPINRQAFLNLVANYNAKNTRIRFELAEVPEMEFFTDFLKIIRNSAHPTNHTKEQTNVYVQVQ